MPPKNPASPFNYLASSKGHFLPLDDFLQILSELIYYNCKYLPFASDHHKHVFVDRVILNHVICCHTTMTKIREQSEWP